MMKNFSRNCYIGTICFVLTLSCGMEEDDDQVQPEKSATKGVVLEKKTVATTDSSAAETDSVLLITYTDNIKPFMESSCAFSGCHSSGTKADGYDLGSYSGNKSSIGATISSIEKGKMPVRGYPEVSQEDLDMLQVWYELGTPE